MTTLLPLNASAWGNGCTLLPQDLWTLCHHISEGFECIVGLRALSTNRSPPLLALNMLRPLGLTMPIVTRQEEGVQPLCHSSPERDDA